MAIEGQIVIERKQEEQEEQEEELITFDGSDFVQVGAPKLISGPSFKGDSSEYLQNYTAEKDGVTLSMSSTIEVGLSGSTEYNFKITGRPDDCEIKENSLYSEEDDDNSEEAYELVENDED